jgi:hypothetical protein
LLSIYDQERRWRSGGTLRLSGDRLLDKRLIPGAFRRSGFLQVEVLMAHDPPQSHSFDEQWSPGLDNQWIIICAD